MKKERQEKINTAKKEKIAAKKLKAYEQNVTQFRMELTELHKAIRNSLVEIAVNVDKNIKNIQELSKTVIPHTDSLKSLSARIANIEAIIKDFVQKEMKNESKIGG